MKETDKNKSYWEYVWKNRELRACDLQLLFIL